MGPIARALLFQKKPVNQSDSWHQNARISVNIQALEECSSSLESVLDLWLFRPCSLRAPVETIQKLRNLASLEPYSHI